jgi:hypothetical protein
MYMFRRWFGRKPAPLAGVPAVRRIKTYPAQNGYVYQYYYEGNRGGTEFEFTCSADRRNWRITRVTVSHAAVHAWEQSHGRALSPTERYALAKMALFAAFDLPADPAELKQAIDVPAADVAGILECLGLE